MTAVDDFLAKSKEQKVRFNGNGQYLLPDPDTGKEKAWVRATNWADTLKAWWMLNRWKQHKLAYGLIQRPDIQCAIAADWDDKDALDRWIADAQEHAGGTEGANFGIALHTFTEIIDGGDVPEHVPHMLMEDLLAYKETMDASGLTSVAIERIVCVPELGVAGKLDRILAVPGETGAAFIGDLKTGQALDLAQPEIAIQLAIYANATHMWMGDHWEPMLPVDHDRAIVMHVPARQGECTLYWVDIAAGWEAATTLCRSVRRWRNRKDLFSEISGPVTQTAEPGEPEGPVPVSTAQANDGGSPGDRADWITTRLMALSANTRARDLVSLRWPDGVTVQPPWTAAQTTALAAMLDDVEAEVGQPWPPRDPDHTEPEMAPGEPAHGNPKAPDWDVLDNGVKAADEDVAGLGYAVSTLMTEAQKERLLGWTRQALGVARPFDGGTLTQRQWLCARAAISMARHLGGNDALERGAVVAVIGRWDIGWSMGAVLGSLTDAQAEQLADLCDAYGSGDKSAFDPF